MMTEEDEDEDEAARIYFEKGILQREIGKIKKRIERNLFG